MRVVSGSARGTKLQSVPGDSTRPILDRVKTALFDILRPRIPGCAILDLFAGSGAVGIEALSQGASHCTFLDIEKAAIQTIKRNLEAARLSKQGSVCQIDSFTFLKKCKQPFDLIYIAPPQYKKLWIRALEAVNERADELLNPGGQIVVQIDPREDQPVSMPSLYETDRRKYGNTLLLFLSKASDLLT